MVEQIKQSYAQLVIETGENEGLAFVLRENIVSIGRGPDNSIQIIDPHMSRNHSLLIQDDGVWFVRDMDSRNGTLLNDGLVHGDQRLANGDRVIVGNTTFLFRHDNPPSPAAAEATSGMRVSTTESDSLVTSQMVKLREELGNEKEITNVFNAPTHEGARLNLMYQVGEMISTTLDLDELLEQVIDLVRSYLQPDRAGILLYDARYKVLLPKVIRRPQDSTEEIVISHSIIDQAIDEQAALLVGDTSHDTRFKQSDSVVKHHIHSAICVPFIYRNETLGVMYLDRRNYNDAFKENDLRLACGIANMAALAIINARMHQKMLVQHAKERELEIARTIQQNLLPKKMPALADFEIAGISEPAHMVGGDYFDVIALPDGRYVLAIADVSGKGVPAAILIAAVRAAVQIEVRNMVDGNLVEVVDRLNHMVCRDTSGSMFVTMVLSILDPVERTLTYCNAGHVHPILCNAAGELEMLDVGGCFLGIMPGLAYEQGTVTLTEESVLLMYSDGVTDMIDETHDLYGIQRLTEFLIGARGLSAEMLCQALEQQADGFRGGVEPFDDLTLLILKATRLRA